VGPPPHRNPDRCAGRACRCRTVPAPRRRAASERGSGRLTAAVCEVRVRHLVRVCRVGHECPSDMRCLRCWRGRVESSASVRSLGHSHGAPTAVRIDSVCEPDHSLEHSVLLRPSAPRPPAPSLPRNLARSRVLGSAPEADPEPASELASRRETIKLTSAQTIKRICAQKIWGRNSHRPSVTTGFRLCPPLPSEGR
jgi:hypothetical protein